MARKRKVSFITLPDWVFPAEPSVYALASAIALADLDGKWVRLSADAQRRLVGAAVFGKREILVEGAQVRVRHSACFGLDSSTSYYSYDEVARAVRKERRL